MRIIETENMASKHSTSTFEHIQQLLDKCSNNPELNYKEAKEQLDRLRDAAAECQEKQSFGDLQVSPVLREEFKALRDCIDQFAKECQKAHDEYETLLFLYNAVHSLKHQGSPIVTRRQGSKEYKKESFKTSFRGQIVSQGSQKKLVRQESFEEPHRQYIKISMDRYLSMEEREKRYVAEVNELTNRLSKMASQQLHSGNPMICDLSDKNRPTKIGERFGEVYDEEWSEAFEDLQSQGYKDDEILKILIDILITAYEFCKKHSFIQLQELQDTMEYVIKHVKLEDGPMEHKVEKPEEHHSYLPCTQSAAKDFRKSAALGSVPALCVLFKNLRIKECIPQLDLSKTPNLECYVDKCVELTWLMAAQDPPMIIERLEEGSPMDKTKYKYFERKGKDVELCVWPAIFLHDKGPLICKGFILPKKKSH